MPGPGRYWGTQPRGTTTKSKSGNPSMAVTFHVAHVWNGDAWAEMQQPYDRTVYVALTDAAWPYSEPKLKGLGFNGDFDNPVFTAEGAELECRLETYEGKQREKWELAGGGEFVVEKADAGMIRDLNRLWKSKQTGKADAPTGKPAAPPARAKKPAGPPAEAVAATAEAPAATGDEIPF